MRAESIVIMAAIVFLAGCQQSSYVCENGAIVNDPYLCERDIIIEDNSAQDDVSADNNTEDMPEEIPDTKPADEVVTRFEGDYYEVNTEKTARGVTLRFLGYYYVKKGDDFGKITGVKYSIINEGAYDMNPSLKLSMVNNAGDRDLRLAEVERQDIVIKTGEQVTEESEAELSFNKLSTEKTLQLELYDSRYKGTNLVNAEINAEFK
jgi:hypothetical protein